MFRYAGVSPTLPIRNRVVVAVLIAVGLCFHVTPVVAQTTGHWLTGYYATYNYDVMTPSQVDYTKLTHVIYWPVIPNADGTLNETPFGLSAATFSSGATALVSGAHAAHAKALIGIGGNADSGASAGFTGATSAANLSAFINNIVALMQAYGFDGVDINWEAIGASNNADNTQFPAFIKALRTKLNTLTPTPLLTMAPAGRPDLLGPIYQNFDQLNVQTYVMSGPYCGWETWYNSPFDNGGATFISVPTEQLPSVIQTLAQYTGVGIPASKLAMGIQFDAAVWTGGSGTSTGGVTKPKQSWTYGNGSCNTPDPGAPNWTTLPYRQMITTLATKAGYTQNFDSVADQSWLSYDPSGTGTVNEAQDSFVSYDSPQSIAKKGQDLVAEQAKIGALGGSFIFELSGDFAATAAAAQQHPLLNAANAMASLLPGAVSGLTATPAATSATLNWTAANGAAMYTVSFENSQGSGAASVAATVSTPQATISGLTPGKQYWFLVAGVDAFGAGTATEVSATIPAGTGSNVPTGVTATAGITQVQLTWTAVPGATSYGVLRSTTSGSGYGAARTATTNAFSDTNVLDGKTYYYVVTATGAFGTSGQSSQVSATPFATVAAPTGLAATLSPGKVSLTWNAAPNATSYHVKRSTTNGTGYALLVTSTTTSATDTSNFNGKTTYYYVVTSVNGTFSSGNSNQVAVTPSAQIPPAPGTPTAVAGAGQVTVNWLAVTSATGYSILRSTTSGSGYTQVGTSETTSYTDTTAIGGYTYYYVIESYNSAGTSGNSPQVSAKPTLPAPTNLTGSFSNNVVTMSWTGVNGATAYQVLRSTTSGTGYASVGTTAGTSLHDNTAIPGTTYYYVVEAYDAKTSGPYSNQITVTVAATKPAAPTGLAAYLAQGGGGVNLTWSKVVGAASYNVLRAATKTGAYAQIGTTAVAMYTDAPLAAGTYYYAVQAVNSAGTSGNSNQASYAVPAQNVPVPPDFTPESNNGVVNIDTLGSAGATTYGYYRSTSAAGPYTLLEQADVGSYTDTTAKPGTTYYYEMTAGNSAGTSAFTAPQSLTVPLAPTGLKATPGNAQISLTWTAVAGASGYRVARGASAGSINTYEGYPTTNTFTDTGLTNGTAYYYEVQTVGADGNSTSAYTAVVSATPVQAQATVTWIPDFDGQLLQVRVGSGTSATAITIALPSCNPNSVAVNQNKAYVVCSANGENPDKILVYNATTIRAAAAGTLAISPLQTITSADFNSLIGVAFDASNNLWVASNGNSEVLEFTAAQLATATPADTVSLADSPSSPVALAFDTDGSLWVTGLYGDGILLNFTPDQFGLGENANPRYCAATDSLGGICITQANLFLEPEGVAVFNGSVWVANNSTTGSNGLGGATPGREIVNLGVSGGVLAVKGIYGTTLPDAGGGTATSPFFCPGGLYGTSTHLWLNDESYGEATPQCGANGDSASKTGAVFSFTPAQLTAKPATQAPAFTNVTGRPGFGGIFVEYDQ